LVKKREDDLALEPLDGLQEWRLWKSSNVAHDGGANGDDTSIDASKTTATTTTTTTTTNKRHKSYRRTTLQGTFQHDNQILIGPRGPPPGALAESGPNSGRGGGGGMSSSMQGYWVVTPFLVGDNDTGVGSSGDMSGVDGQTSVQKEKRGLLDRLRFWRRNDLDTNNNSDTKTSSSSSPNKEEGTIVWINRGWIPRHYINNNAQVLQSWEQPSGIVKLTAMESEMETPGTFSPPSRLVTHRRTTDANADKGGKEMKKLLWMDREAMEEMTGAADHSPLFVQINDSTTNSNSDNDGTNNGIQFPVKPSQEYVGEFKVTPEIHVGYAVTWFGLSGAGVIMTRKLLTRGR
jgi:surfeit locus 1 family protein